MDKRSWRY